MPPLAKEDIKDIFTGALEPFVKAIQGDFGAVKEELGKTRSELKDEISGIRLELAEVKSDVKWMKENSGELFTKLDKFISLYQDERQERSILANQVKRLEERMDRIEAKMGKG